MSDFRALSARLRPFGSDASDVDVVGLPDGNLGRDRFCRDRNRGENDWFWGDIRSFGGRRISDSDRKGLRDDDWIPLTRVLPLTEESCIFPQATVLRQFDCGRRGSFHPPSSIARTNHILVDPDALGPALSSPRRTLLDGATWECQGVVQNPAGMGQGQTHAATCHEEAVSRSGHGVEI